MNVLGVIPARGGSKGVKDKNIRIIAGEPLIQYAINACKESGRLSTFVVSTDSEKIMAIAERTGTQVIQRPKEIAMDTSSVVDAALHVLKALEKTDYHFDAIMLLQPTSPIRTGDDIDKAIELLEESTEIDGVISVIRVEDTHPARMYKVEQDGIDQNLQPLQPLFENCRRQDLPPIFHRNGAIYLVRREQLVENRTFMPKKKIGIVMRSDYSVNIDTELDVLTAEVILTEWTKSRVKK